MVKKVFIVIYSMHGHVYKLAEKMKEGLEKVQGIEAKIFQVQETLPEEGSTPLSSLFLSQTPLFPLVSNQPPPLNLLPSPQQY